MQMKVSIYPNPANSSFTVFCPEQKFSLDIYDHSGSKILTERNLYQAITIRTEKLSGGLYFVRVTLPSGHQWTGKLVVV
jgi:hypothetical protein